jgi:hypothetical protein
MKNKSIIIVVLLCIVLLVTACGKTNIPIEKVKEPNNVTYLGTINHGNSIMQADLYRIENCIMVLYNGEVAISCSN